MRKRLPRMVVVQGRKPYVCSQDSVEENLKRNGAGSRTCSWTPSDNRSDGDVRVAMIRPWTAVQKIRRARRRRSGGGAFAMVEG